MREATGITRTGSKLTRTETADHGQCQKQGEDEEFKMGHVDYGLSRGSLAGEVQETAADTVWCSGYRRIDLGFIDGWQ